MEAPAASASVSIDAFLGGRFMAVQPRHGHHRAGLDAVLLAAAIDSDFGGAVVDLGAGTGVAGMAVAARCPETRVTLVERDAEAVRCAREAMMLPENAALAARVAVVAADLIDAAARAAAGLAEGAADAVIMNPPYRDPDAGTAPPAESRRAAYVLEAGLDPWLRAAASLLRPQGTVAAIFRADGLDTLLTACRGRFGAIAVLPVAPRADAAATRVILRATKGSRAALRLLPPLVLHPASGNGYLPAADAVLRGGVSLADVHPAWATA